jgi:putative transposase
MIEPLAIVLTLLTIAIVMFVLNRPRMDAVALIMLATLPFTGVLTMQEALAGFSDSNVVLIAAMQFAKENPTWGYDRIADALANIGHKVSDQTVGNVLKEHGIEPAPERKRTTTWSTFLKAHWDQLAAIDFTTVEVWTSRGLVTYYLLFAMRLATRQVCFLGCTPNPVHSWMAQMARNLTDAFDGLLREPVRYVLLDRDTKFTAEFQAILKAADVEPALLPPKSPNCNAFLERFFRALKEEALARIIPFSEAALLKTTTDFLLHYHGERPHQGLDHRVLQPGPEVGQKEGSLVCRERLGGLLRYYYRQTA